MRQNGRLKDLLLILGGLAWLAYTFTPLGLLIWEVVVEVRLDPATCQIKERVKDDFYDVFVIPEDDTEPFSKVVEVPVTDSDDVFEEGDKLECFFKIDHDDEETDIVVQFHSDRRKPDAVDVALLSVWFAANILIFFCVMRGCVWKRDVPTVA